MRSKHAFAGLTTCLLALAVGALALPGMAFAQEVEVTPQTSVTPTKTVQPWIYQMAVGAVILGVIVLIAVAVAYLRFSPKFFGREEARPRAPGARPPILAREAAARRPPVPVAAPAAAPAALPQAAATATAVVERPAPVAREPAETPAAAATAVAEPAGTQTEPSAATEPAPAEAPTAETEAPAAEAPAAPAAEAAPVEPAPPVVPAAPAASHGGAAAMDQETFDRVLQEQLDKGVDRRVAEGRARAAAVVAARKKAQG